MRKLVLVGNSSEREQLIKLLHMKGCAQIVSAPRRENTRYADKQSALETYGAKKAKIDFVFDLLKSCQIEAQSLIKAKKITYKPVKKPFLAGKPSLTMEEFYKTPELEKDVFETAERLERLSEELLKNKANEIKLKNTVNQLQPYKEVDAKLESFKDTANVCILLGSVPSSRKAAAQKAEDVGAYMLYYDSGANCTVVSIFLKEKYDEIAKILSDVEFSACTLNYTGVPKDIISESEKLIESNQAMRAKLIEQIISFEYILDDCKRLYDYYLIEERKLECEMQTSCTETSYILEAWVPKDESEKLDRSLDGSGLALMYEIREPEEGEKPPTYVEDNAVVEPYQSVTNMFSAPAYREINPNPFVAFFFFIFFGMMLADAVYGLILTVFTGIVLAKQRPPKGQASLIKIIFMGAISTIIWGVVFGSYFGFSAKDLGIWCWFNPIDEPMKMLYLSLAMGIFQMCFGLGINMVAMFRQKKPLDAISGTLSWYFMLIGLAMAFGSSLITAITMPAWVKTAGYVLLIVGVVLLMISGALHKKGAKKVSGALGSLYGIVNFFSDLMSYTRIFGLGLASAVIGMVFNEIGDVVMNLIPVKAIGIVAMAIVLLIGHVFNIGINTLGAYVHNSRLQFVEFFGKFYTGGGELFRPLGSEMKYYYISNQEVKK